MNKIKCSVDIGKTGSCGHNDRTTTYNAKNIDVQRSHLNQYWNCYNDNSITFAEAEYRFYKERYTATINAQNERNRKAGHSERNKTIEDYLRDEKTKPYNMILQIGNRDNQIDNDMAIDLIKKQIHNMQKKYPNMHIITWAIHLDETTPHGHVRFVFDYSQNDTNIINQTKALQEMGFELPFPQASVSKSNNVMVSWTRDVREEFEELAEANLPLEIDRERVPGKYNVEQEEYIRNKNRELWKENGILVKQNHLFLNQTLSLKQIIREIINRILRAMHELEERYPIVLEKFDIGNFNPCPEWTQLVEYKKELEADILQLDSMENDIINSFDSELEIQEYEYDEHQEYGYDDYELSM